MSGSRILLTGATGMIGGLLAAELRRRGAPFTVLLRPSSDASRFTGADGVTVVRGDLDDPSTLPSALEGVDRAFLLTNSSPRAEAQQLAFVDAARSAGVARLVNLSQLHTAADSPVRFLRYHAAVEAAIRDSGPEWTILRPNLVLQAFIPLAAMLAQGVLQAPIPPDARVSAVDARDIAAVAAVALTEDSLNGQVLDITGPRAVTHPEIADAFGFAIGRVVRFEQVPSEAYVDAMAASGMPRWQADGVGEDYAHYARGEAADAPGDVQRVTGAAPRSVQTFAADHADALAGR